MGRGLNFVRIELISVGVFYDFCCLSIRRFIALYGFCICSVFLFFTLGVHDRVLQHYLSFCLHYCVVDFLILFPIFGETPWMTDLGDFTVLVF